MAFDQMHEQNNKTIKGSGGAKHLLNKCDESGLIRWETIGTDIARIIVEFEESIDIQGKNIRTKHHEDNASFQKNFVSDIKKVISSFTNNPFKLNELTSIGNTTIVFPDIVFKNISMLETCGKKTILLVFLG